jgi:hypothetical protein
MVHNQAEAGVMGGQALSVSVMSLKSFAFLKPVSHVSKPCLIGSL